MELATQSIEKIKTLQEKRKTYAPLMELTTKSMKKKIKKTSYLIQSSQAIIKRNIHASLGHGIISRLQKQYYYTLDKDLRMLITLCCDTSYYHRYKKHKQYQFFLKKNYLLRSKY